MAHDAREVIPYHGFHDYIRRVAQKMSCRTVIVYRLVLCRIKLGTGDSRRDIYIGFSMP